LPNPRVKAAASAATEEQQEKREIIFDKGTEGAVRSVAGDLSATGCGPQWCCACW